MTVKKILVLGFLILTLLGITGCSSAQYEGWKTVSIEQCGTFKIPNEWSFHEEDGLVFMTDQNEVPIVIQTFSYSGMDAGDPGEAESNRFANQIVNLQTLSSAVFSNSVIYGKALMERDGIQSENYYLELGYERMVLLIFWDQNTEEKFVQKMARSFVSYP